jgi:hypothetical protein
LKLLGFFTLSIIQYSKKPENKYSIPLQTFTSVWSSKVSQTRNFSETVNSVGSPCYALAGFLHEILSPLAGKSESFIKNLGHFIQLLKSVNLQTLDTLVSTNVPVDEALQVIRNMLHNDNTLVEWTTLQVKAIMELVEV